MKNLRKIITLFFFIFFTGIFITVITINTSLNKIDTKNETVEIKNDTISFLKRKKKTV